MTSPPRDEPPRRPARTDSPAPPSAGAAMRPTAWQFLKKVVTDFLAHEDMQMAAALAYYAIFSVAPLLILAIMFASLFYDPQDVRGEMQTQIRDLVGAEAADQINVMMANVQHSEEGRSATLFSILAILIGATGAVSQLQVALNKAYDVPPPGRNGLLDFLWKRLLSLLLILGIGFLLLASLIAGTTVAIIWTWFSDSLPPGWSGTLLLGVNYLISFAIITLLFTAIFKFLSDARLAWSDVAVGAIVTALLFVVGNFLIGQYLSRSSVGSVYGAAGSLAILLLWIYYSAMIVLLGAEFTQVWARSYGRQILPANGSAGSAAEGRRESAPPR